MTNRLSQFGVSVHVSKHEFVDILSPYPLPSLKSKRKVKQLINKLRATQTRRNIQCRDRMFKEKDLKSSHAPASCNKIRCGDGTTSDPTEMRSAFQNYFSNISSSQLNPSLCEESIRNLFHLSYSNANTVLQQEFDLGEVNSAVKKLKSGKAAGPDKITAEHIKHGGPVLISWICKIFNRILILEEIPPCLKAGFIIPLYKAKGKDPLLVSSYRGITISPVLSKLLEIIILQRLNPILEDLNIPSCLQTAYRKGLSCSDATFTTQEALLVHLREGGKYILVMTNNLMYNITRY